MPTPDDNAGPTPERLQHAREGKTHFWDLTGRARSTRKFTMLDDALGRAWKRHQVSAQEYSALKRYAHHWAAGGLQSPMQSVDLNRIYAFDPASMSGLCKTEAQAHHRKAYYEARSEIGTRPAFVSDQVACYDNSLLMVGHMLGYRSPFHARENVRLILSDAGYRLAKLWSRS